MHVAAKLTLPIACLSLLLGACSSSGGASPLDSFDFGEPSNVDNSVDTVDAVTDSSTNEVSDETDQSTVSSGFVPTEIIGAAQVDVLQGLWETGCSQISPGYFQIGELSVVGPRLIWSFSLFDDQECTNPAAVNTVLSGSTIQQEATTVPTGATTQIDGFGTAVAVDFHFEQATVDNRPIPDENFLDKERFLAHIDYDIVFRQDGNLYFGDTSIEGFDGTAPESRPETLNFITTYTRAQ